MLTVFFSCEWFKQMLKSQERKQRLKKYIALELHCTYTESVSFAIMETQNLTFVFLF